MLSIHGMASVRPYSVAVPRVRARTTTNVTFAVSWDALDPAGEGPRPCVACGAPAVGRPLLRTAWRVTRAARLLEVAWLGMLLAVFLWLVPSSLKAAWRGAVTPVSLLSVVAVLVSFKALYLMGLAVLRRCACEHTVVPVTACDGCRGELWWSGAPSALQLLVGPVALALLFAVLPARWEKWCLTCVSPELASHVLAGIAAGLCCVALVAWRREGRRPVFQLLQRDERRVVLRGPPWWRDALGGRAWTAPEGMRGRTWAWLTAVPWLR